MTSATRRSALRRAALGAGVVATPGLLRPAIAQAQDTDDEVELGDFLVEAVALEQIAAIAYQDAASVEGLRTNLRQTLRRFARQEEAHATALGTALDSIGVEPPDPPSGPRDSRAIETIDRLDAARASELADLLGRLSGLERQAEYLEYLVELETEQIRLYLGATPEFVSEDLLRTGAEIAGCEAQHVVVLREAMGTPPARAVPELPSQGGG